MPDWISFRLKTEPANMKHVQTRIVGFPKEVTEKYFFQFLQYVAATGADIGREYIGSAAVSTRTGDSDGRTGRVKSGTMQSNFKWRGGKEGDKYNFEIGWVDGTPGYAIFQEQGTKNGVVAMDAMGHVMEWVRSELKFYEGFKKGMRVSNPARFGDN